MKVVRIQVVVTFPEKARQRTCTDELQREGWKVLAWLSYHLPRPALSSRTGLIFFRRLEKVFERIGVLGIFLSVSDRPARYRVNAKRPRSKTQWIVPYK